MPKRPVAEALARANNEAPLEWLPDFPVPEHAALCALLTSNDGSECDCGIRDAQPLRANGVELCGAMAAWGVHCTAEVEHRGSHSWQDQDRFPTEPPADTALVPLKDAEEVWGEKNGQTTFPGLETLKTDRKAKGPRAMPTEPVSMTATLKRLGYKSGTQADPDAYVEMVIRTNDLSVGAELGWQTGKTLTVTMQPEQPRLAGSEAES